MKYFKTKIWDTYFETDDDFEIRPHLLSITKEDYIKDNPRLIFWKKILDTVKKWMILWFFLEDKQFVTIHARFKTIKISDQYTYKYYHTRNRLYLNDNTLKKYCSIINLKLNIK